MERAPAMLELTAVSGFLTITIGIALESDFAHQFKKSLWAVIWAVIVVLMIFSTILFGLRVSRFVGTNAVLFPMVIKITPGLIAANLGGRSETIIMRIADMRLTSTRGHADLRHRLRGHAS